MNIGDVCKIVKELKDWLIFVQVAKKDIIIVLILNMMLQRLKKKLILI